MPAPRPRTEDELVSAAQRGDTEAYGELVGMHQAGIYHLCLRLLASPAEAQDAAQDTFLAAYRALSRFTAGRPLRPWLVTIATRLCLNVLRKRKRAGEVGLAQEPLAPSGPDTGDLDEALARLREVPRAVVVLFYLEGHSCAQVAEILSLSESAVKVTLHRAREQLRGWLR